MSDEQRYSITQPDSGKYGLEMSDSNHAAAIIVAAGRGERVGNPHEGPKQYRLIGGKPVISRTLQPFLEHPDIQQIAVVIHPDDEDLYKEAVAELPDAENIQVITGGATRQQSVCNGLEALSEHPPKTVLVHDGVRPFVDAHLISRVLAKLESADAALPAIPVSDTVKSAGNGNIVDSTVPRDGLYAAQTPQGFHFEPIIDAHRQAATNTDTGFTDDSSIAEWASMSVHLVAGDPENIKLTVARDLEMADRKLSLAQGSTPAATPDIRTGNGYDVHAVSPGDHVVLCGIRIDHDHGLLGHSDADVGLHALTDALLATCADGDIGDHFPPSDPQWKDADSGIFLKHAMERVRAAGGILMLADITLICEAPKIGPHRPAMRQYLSEVLGIDIGRCSVKATTNESIGFVGRREGIAAIATATVSFQE